MNKNVKAKLELTLSFTMTMTDGSGKHVRYPIKIICRADIEKAHDWAAGHSSKRDYLIFRVIMKTGLRTREVCTLHIEDIDFETSHIRVLDSKKHSYFTEPWDIGTNEMVRQFVGGIIEGLLFTQTHSWVHAKRNVPLTDATIWRIVHRIGLSIRIPNLNPRHLRDYFAAQWEYGLKGTRNTLKACMRHESSESTDHYLDAMIDSDDIDAEYHEKMDSRYFNPPTVCANCASLRVCKYADRMPTFATGCAFKPTINKEA